MPALPARLSRLLPLTGLTRRQFDAVVRDLARLKDWQVLRQCRRRGDAIDHVTAAVAYLHNTPRRPGLTG